MRSPRIVAFTASSALLASLALVSWPALADDDDADHKRSQATAAFGRGLNTAQPGNPVNHAILPRQIKIKAGGVVDFAVAGFHDVVIFKPGFTLAHLAAAGGGVYPLTAPIFVIPADPAAPLPAAIAFLADSLYYRGINPAGGPLATPVSGNPANGRNRSEPVAFFDKGTYLVICNIRPHLLDGMVAYVKVD